MVQKDGSLTMFELNRVYCIDCLDGLRELPDCSIDLIIADPPFNKGKNYGESFNDNLPLEDYYQWCELWIREGRRVLKSTGSFYIYVNSQHLGRFQVIGQNYLIWRNTIVWHYTNPTPSRRSYPKTWSAFLFFTKTNNYVFNRDACRIKAFHTNLKFLDDKTTRLYDVWWDVSKLVHGFLAQEECVFFPGTKKRVFGYQLPEKLIERIVLTSSKKGELVLDLFSHSGITSLVSQRLGRNFLGFEINPDYVDNVNNRLSEKRG